MNYQRVFLQILLSLGFITNFVWAEAVEGPFIKKRIELNKYTDRADVVMVASIGRSGSSVLYHTLLACADGYTVLKTHILPPDPTFKGKIIFIFSKPDTSIESALYQSLTDRGFIIDHFNNMELSDRGWLAQVHGGDEQTISNNLLCYDALGYGRQMNQWLVLKTVKADHPVDAQIMAIKYEDLWDPATIQGVMDFLGVESLPLPLQKDRRYKDRADHPAQRMFIERHNRGTDSDPIYQAYDEPRKLWAQAPAFQFLNLTDAR